jgi:hypothetical protein
MTDSTSPWYGHHRGQAFRDGRYREAHREQEDIDEPPTPQERDGENDDAEAEPKEGLAELRQPPLERRDLGFLSLEKPGDATQLGPHPRGDTTAEALPAVTTVPGYAMLRRSPSGVDGGSSRRPLALPEHARLHLVSPEASTRDSMMR